MGDRGWRSFTAVATMQGAIRMNRIKHSGSRSVVPRLEQIKEQ